MGRSTEEWELWTWREVARALKVSRSWIYARAESGELPSLRIGGMLRFDPVAIQHFALESPRSGTDPAPGSGCLRRALMASVRRTCAGYGSLHGSTRAVSAEAGRPSRTLVPRPGRWPRSCSSTPGGSRRGSRRAFHATGEAPCERSSNGGSTRIRAALPRTPPTRGVSGGTSSSPPLALLRLNACTPAAVEALLDAKEREGLRPQTVNHLRAFLSRAFAAALRVGRWPGTSPVPLVRKRKVPKATVGDHLRLEEVPRVLAQLHPRWRPLFATAIYTGLRKGELAALRREDVDLEDAAPGRSAKLGAATPRRAGTPTLYPSPRRSCPGFGTPSAVPLRARLSPRLRRQLPEEELPRTGRHAFARGRARGSSPSGARSSGHRARMEARVPSAGLSPQGACFRRRPPALPQVQDAALAQAGRPPHSVPRPPSHDGDAASPREGAPGRRAEGAPTPRPEADRAGLRTPRHGLPAHRSESAQARRNAAARGAQGEGGRGRPCDPRVTHPGNAEGAGAARGKPERLRPLQRVGETGFEPATPWSRTKCSTRLSHSPRPTPLSSREALRNRWRPRGSTGGRGRA